MELEVPIVSRPKRRRDIVVFFLVVIFAVGGFLIGYFLMKAEKDTVKCHDVKGTSKPNLPSNKERYHKLFQNEIKAKNIEDNLK